MAKVNSRIGLVGVVVVALATVATNCSESDELPRGLGERISRTLIDEAFPLAAAAFDTEVKITASDGVANDWFGRSVAISGDTAIVGAPDRFVAGTVPGSAYVFQQDEGGVNNWGEVTKIAASDGAAGDWFGSFVAISGDTAIVGAPSHFFSRGAAYVYQRDEGAVDNWGQVTKITVSDGAGVWFGRSVAISGDTAIVGRSDHGYPGSSGSAFVYRRDEGGVDNWGEVGEITASDAMYAAEFGSVVTISGDTAIVGAPWSYCDDGVLGCGAAYVYQRDEGGTNNWGEVTKITGPADEFFIGSSVSISGDTAIVIGWRGRIVAHIYHRDEGGSDNWGRVTTIDNDEASLGGSRFTAIDGDTVIIGAPEKRNNGIRSGSAYVYQRDKGGANNWGEVTEITASDGAADDWFGSSVGISGDTPIVGAYLDDDNGSRSGSAYVYFGVVCNDNDGDGYGSPGDASCPNGAAEDCDDTNAAISPGATEVCTGAADDDCDGFVDCDDVDCTCDVACDVTDPVITCPANPTIECDASTDPANTGTATAADDCDPMPVISFSDDVVAGACADESVITRTWTSTDASSNSDSCDQIITVEDTTNPVITCPSDVTLDCGDPTDPDATGSATATDNCDPAPGISFDDVETPTDCLADPIMKTITRTWTATDRCDNVSPCDQTITVLKQVLKLDIEPGSCPNRFSSRSVGLRAALIGTDDVGPIIDIGTVVFADLMLSRADCVGEGVAPPVPPSQWVDVATPFDGELCDCHALGGDRIPDLVMKFNTRAVYDALQISSLAPGDTIEVAVTGTLADGCEFIASDCLFISE